MNSVDLKNIQKVCKEFNNDVEEIGKKLKVVQSQKCKLKKLKKTATYDSDMQKLLDYEQVLKEARALLVPHKKFVTEFEQADIDRLDYDETVKALKSIQSKKCLSQQYADQTEYEKSVVIENMLKVHIKDVKPVDEAYVRRSELQKVIDTIENTIVDISVERILEMLKEL